MSDLLNEFLKKERKRRCAVCANEEVAEIIKAHLDKLLYNETTITLNEVHIGLIMPTFGTPKSMDTIRKHVRQCLNRDPVDGRNLS